MKLLRNFMMALSLVAFVSCGNGAATADSAAKDSAKGCTKEQCDKKEQCAEKAACAEKKCPEAQCDKAACAEKKCAEGQCKKAE